MLKNNNWAVINSEGNLLKQCIGEETYIFTHKEFKDIVGTIYAEATKGEKGSWQESAAIYCVVLNRATADKNTSMHKEIQEGGIYGWIKRNDINSKFASEDDKKNAYKGVIKGVLDSKDYSNGAYYWHGTDFCQTNKPAYKSFYLVGCNFSKTEYDIWKLGNKKVENKKWEYTYEVVNAIGKTTFLKLSKEWKIANRYKKW